MSRFEQLQRQGHDDELASLAYEDDLTMEQILDNISHTPMGQVLRRIASLPQARRDKVLDVRRSLLQGRYEINTRLDRAIERAVEDLKT